MTNFIVNSPQTLLTGTTGNDLFQIQTSLAVSVYGIEGNDEFSGGFTGLTLTQSIFNAGAGNDTLNVSGVAGTLGSILGGGGSDLISANLGGVTKQLLQGGGDNDTINFNFSGTQLTVNGNAGNDFLSGVIASGFASKFLLGGGDDTVNLTAAAFSASTLQGGGGADLISATITGGTFGSVVIAGDTELTQGEFDGNDTITIASGAAFLNGLIQGNGGNDSIDLGGLGAGNTIGGNGGNDTVVISGATNATRTQVNMGGGNDVISGTFSGASQDLSLNGGGGNDTIFVSGAAGLSGTTAFVFGDDGADVINLRADAASVQATGLQLAYDAASQSNLAAFDSVSAAGSGFVLMESYINAVTGSTSNAQINVTGGAATFTATYTLGVTARVEGLNSLLTTQGAAAFFSDGLGSEFVFVQGGSASSTTDDLLVKNATGAISGIAVGSRGAGLLGSVIQVTL